MGDFIIIKKKDVLLRIYIILSFIFLHISLNYYFTRKFKTTSIDINNPVKTSKNLINKEPQLAENKFITIPNGENHHITMAKIIRPNKINYIPKISIIIPVHNAEEYLDKSLDSIINQTLLEIEIICVDDGSTDNSMKILKNYSLKDNRILVMKQEIINSGIAKNTGLMVAKGYYLSFLNSYEFYQKNMLEEMYNIANKKQNDIIISQCNYICCEFGKYNNQHFNSILSNDLLPKKEFFSVSDISNNIFQIFEGRTANKLFRTDFIKSNGINFHNLKYFNEDQFTYISLCLAKSISFLEKTFLIKSVEYKKSLLTIKNKDTPCLLLSINKIKSKLEKL